MPTVDPSPVAVKAAGSGVDWVGSTSARQVWKLDATVDPDAEELTRGIALATSAYCYTAVMYRAAKFSEPPLYVAQEDVDGGETVVQDHDLMFLFDVPSPDFEMSELLALTEVYMLITGACLWLKMRDPAGRVSRLQPFSSDEVRTYSSDGRIYGRFEVLTTGGHWKPYPPEDVVWFRELNPLSWRSSLSKVDVALSQLDLGHQVNRTVRNFMKKAMFPGGVVSPDKDWDPEPDEWDAYKNAIDAWYTGPANAGAPLVLQGGTTFSRAAIPLKELLPAELLDRIESVVSSVFGVPPIVLGWKIGLENSPWSQMGEARQSMYEETTIPRWNTISRKMSRQMLPPEDIASKMTIKFDLTDVAALRADDKARADVASLMREEWTLNERRIYTGQEPLPEDDPRGDEIGTGGGGMDDLFNLGDAVDTVDEADDEEDDTGPKQAHELFATGDEDAALDLLSKHIYDVPASKADTKQLEWMLFELNTKAAERTWTRSVKAILDDQLEQVLRLANKYVHPTKADGLDPDSTVEFISALAEWITTHGDKQVARGLYPLVVSTGTLGLKRAAAQTGLSFSVLEPGLLNYAKEEADFLASVMGETMGRKVARVVQKRLKMGGLLADLRKDLEKSSAFSRDRAKLVSRTETTRAWNGAQRRGMSDWERAQDEKARAYKEWLDSMDDRVRDEHILMRGEKRRVDEAYSNGLQEPSEPNCRCTQLFSIETVGA